MEYTTTLGIQESFAERKIAELLIDYAVLFEQEVSFKKCISPITLYQLRFDFYIPSMNVLIEYDGKDFHSDKDVKYRDGIKNKFAKENGIRLIRVQGISNISQIPKKLKLKKVILEPKEKKVPFTNDRIKERQSKSDYIKYRIREKKRNKLNKK